jgi:hypothetical protein
MKFHEEAVAMAGADDRFSLQAADVVEVPLLLEGWQMSALERAAYLRGLTAAEMVRQLLREFIAEQPACR